MSFASWPGSEMLRREMAEALVKLTGPDGSWKSLTTSAQMYKRWRPLATFCAENRIQSLDLLKPEHWRTHKEATHGEEGGSATTNGYLSAQRRLLLGHDGLREDTRQAVLRAFSVPTDREQRTYYSIEEFKALRSAARGALRRAEQRIAPNWLLARLPPEQVPDHLRLKWEALNAVLNGGFPSTGAGWVAIGARPDGALRGGSKRLASQTLFLDAFEVIAAMTVLVCEGGENVATMTSRSKPNTSATAGDLELTVLSSDLDKPRRGPRLRRMRENVQQHDPLGLALQRVTDVTEPARASAARQGLPDAHRLLWCADRRGGALHNNVEVGWIQRRRSEAKWLEGLPSLDFPTLRRTYVSRIATREVHQSARTRLEQYVGRDPEQRLEWAAVAAAGLEALFAEAESTVARLLTHEEAQRAGLLERTPGDYLTPTGMGCRDSDHHPDTNLPCDDDFLCCLGCANAFATEDHLSLLVTVYDLLDQAREAHYAGEWERRFQVAWARLTVLLNRLTEHQWAQARTAATDEDRALAYDAVIGRGFEI